MTKNKRVEDLLMTAHELFIRYLQKDRKLQINDGRVWKLLDSKKHSRLFYEMMDHIAQHNPYYHNMNRTYNKTVGDWLQDKLNQPVFQARDTASERNKSCENNTMIWMLMNQFLEMCYEYKMQRSTCLDDVIKALDGWLDISIDQHEQDFLDPDPSNK